MNNIELNEETTKIVIEKHVGKSGAKIIKVNGESHPMKISHALTGTHSDAEWDMGIFTNGKATFYFGDFCEEFRFDDDDVVAFDQPAQKIADTLAARVATVRRWVQSCRGKGETATAIIPT